MCRAAHGFLQRDSRTCNPARTTKRTCRHRRSMRLGHRADSLAPPAPPELPHWQQPLLVAAALRVRLLAGFTPPRTKYPPLTTLPVFPAVLVADFTRLPPQLPISILTFDHRKHPPLFQPCPLATFCRPLARCCQKPRLGVSMFCACSRHRCAASLCCACLY